jgi:hypothetical protein
LSDACGDSAPPVMDPFPVWKPPWVGDYATSAYFLRVLT